MKQFYSFGLVAILSSFICVSAAFTPKPFYYEAVGIDSDYDSYLNDISLGTFFEYPDDLPATTNLTDLAQITFTSSDPTVINVTGCTYNDYYQRMNITIQQKAKKIGRVSLVTTVVYEGETYTSTAIFNIIPLQAVDDNATVLPGGKVSINPINNDKSATSKVNATLRLLSQPVYGSVSIVPGTNFPALEYTANADATNYSKDIFQYEVTTAAGHADTANIVVDIHLNSYVTKVFDYLPAPGQFVNEAAWGKYATRNNVIGESSSGVSLGGWGGYIIVGFDQPIVNRPENPYGVDFTVVGNAMANWSEPAAVMVMQDLNGNGLPDDGEWYELAGSEYHFRNTKKNMTMTYINPKYDVRYTVPFYTNYGTVGALLTNQFHNHSYYPDPIDFNINPDSVTYSGTFTPYLLDKSKRGYIQTIKLPLFGYADSKVSNPTPTKPRNPYFTDANGASADGFDLSWAVDRNGNPVQLDSVHFVKIYSTAQEDAGWLGEVSPEVLKVAITTPDPAYVPQDYYAHEIGVAPLQILKGTSYNFEGILFKNGKPEAGSQKWSSSDLAVGTIDNNGVFSALETGKTTISFSQKEGIAAATIPVEIVELQGVTIELEGNSATNVTETSAVEGETIIITAQGIDNRAEGANRFVYETFNWTSSDPTVGTVNSGLFTALKAGVTVLTATSTSKPELSKTITVTVTGKPTIELIKETIEIEEEGREGVFTPKDLFLESKKASIFFKNVSVANSLLRLSTDLLDASIVDNTLVYSFKDEKYGKEKLLLDVEYFNEVKTYVLFLENKMAVSIDEVVAENQINVYPNPFVSGFYINLEDASTAQVTVVDLLGKTLLKQDVNNNSYISMDQYPAGQYVVTVNTNTGKRLSQVIIKR